MSRTRAAVALVAVTAALVAGPATAASAADCGWVLDHVAGQLPQPAQQVYTKVCGV